MEQSATIYDALADLYVYPNEQYLPKLRSLVIQMPESAGALLREFCDDTDGLELHELEEAFTRAFDLNPAVCPEIGWHLFGERYDRGKFMVWVRAQMREMGIEECDELPDHLVHVLPVLGRLSGDEQKQFATQAVEPAMANMVAKSEESSTMFTKMLMGTQEFLVSTHGAPAWKVEDTIATQDRDDESLIGCEE